MTVLFSLCSGLYVWYLGVTGIEQHITDKLYAIKVEVSEPPSYFGWSLTGGFSVLGKVITQLLLVLATK